MNVHKTMLAVAAAMSASALLADFSYLETDGTAYIDTGVPGIMNVHAKIKVFIPQKPKNTTWRILGCHQDYATSDNTWASLFELTSQKFIAYSYKGYRQPTVIMEYPFGEWKEWETKFYKGEQWSKFDNGDAYASSAEKGQISYTGEVRTLHLFKVDNRGSFDGAHNCEAGTRIASLQIWSDDIDATGETLVRDFVPAKDSNGVACLWDKVGQKYYYSETGSGLTYGEDHTSALLTWIGTDAGGAFSDGKNWDTGKAPVSGDSLLFPKTMTGEVSLTNDIRGLTVENILLANRGMLRIVQSEPLTVTGEIVSSSKAGNGLNIILR